MKANGEWCGIHHYISQCSCDHHCTGCKHSFGPVEDDCCSCCFPISTPRETRMKFGNELLDMLGHEGMACAADINDGIEPNGGRFGWTLEYKGGSPVLEVFLYRVDADDLGEEEPQIGRWVLTPE